MSILVVILLLLCGYLAWRLRSTRRIVADLIEAARESKPLLLAESNPVIRAHQLDRLVAEFNRLLSEKDSITGAGREYHGQIQALLGNLREAVAMVDPENTIVSANAALRELTDLHNDPQGKRLDSLIQGTPFLEFIQQVRREGVGRLTEIKVRINQASRWLEVSAAPLEERSRKGGRYTLFILHDITRQKSLEKMRTEFIANVSHELRTPVTIIKGFAETLMDDDAVLEPEEKRRFLSKICNNSERLHSLLQDLLLLTRLESAEMVLQKERLALNAFLGEHIENWQSSRRMEGLSVTTAFGPETGVEADPLRLSQVLGNLLENARQHARGATRICIGTERVPDGVRVYVEDDGPGIPEKDLPHIFQRFFRVEKGRSRESGGTGLGLSIVKHIIAQHGGEISARSRVGEGTCIEFTLPLPPGPGQEEMHRAVSEK